VPVQLMVSISNDAGEPDVAELGTAARWMK